MSAAVSAAPMRSAYEPIAGERAEEGLGGHGVAPEFDVEEHHRTERAEQPVVVLRGVLEHLLHRARRAGSEHDTTRREGEQAVLADRVGEVLGDVGGELVGRLVPVEPRRHGQARGSIREGVTNRPAGGEVVHRTMRKSVATASNSQRGVERARHPPGRATRRDWRPPSAPGPPPVATCHPVDGTSNGRVRRPRGTSHRSAATRGRPSPRRRRGRPADAPRACRRRHDRGGASPSASRIDGEVPAGARHAQR